MRGPRHAPRARPTRRHHRGRQHRRRSPPPISRDRRVRRTPPQSTDSRLTLVGCTQDDRTARSAFLRDSSLAESPGARGRVLMHPRRARRTRDGTHHHQPRQCGTARSCREEADTRGGAPSVRCARLRRRARLGGAWVARPVCAEESTYRVLKRLAPLAASPEKMASGREVSTGESRRDRGREVRRRMQQVRATNRRRKALRRAGGSVSVCVWRAWNRQAVLTVV